MQNLYTGTSNSSSIGIGKNLLISSDPFNLFIYDINFVAATAKGGTQSYGNNTNDGRFFRDEGNSTATFCPAADGTLVSVANAGLRRTDRGHWSYAGASNSCRQNRSLDNVTNWTATNATVTKTATGANGAANAASRVAFTGANGTVLQSLTVASNTWVLSADMRLQTGAGAVEMTLDNGTTWTVVNLTSTYQQVYISQAAVTNPVFGFRGQTGTTVDIDFATLSIPPISGLNIPSQYRVATTTASVNAGQSRAVANVADSGPFNSLVLSPYAFYWQGRSTRSATAGIITGITDTFVTGSTAGLTFAQGGGTATTAADAWKVGLDQVNKVAGYCTASSIKVACNGVVSTLATGVTFPSSLDHWDFATNGAGSRSLMGVSERFAMGPNITFTDAQLVFMTT